MQQFEELFKDYDIISYICRVRAKLAKQRNKKHTLHILTSNENYNYHTQQANLQSKYEKDLLNLLNSILPPRRKWKKLGEKSRLKMKKNGPRQKLSTVDKNLYSLIKTVKYYRLKEPKETFIVKLDEFVKDIQQAIRTGNYSVSKPTIYPKAKDKKRLHELKGDERNTCRPLSLFHLKDRLILSFANNYLTRLFDKYFDECSLAFRAIPHQVVNHHTAIRKIIEYKKQHTDTPLWVAECDMKKFYDSVNHKLILEQFDKLLEIAQREKMHLKFDICRKIFVSYLDCYSFNHDVFPRNDDLDYWKEFNIPQGEYGWIENEIKQLGFYDDVIEERIGIPQGGALSGLIANIVLNIADNIMVNNFKDLFYIRFCDDMIIMHPDRDVCERGMQLYKQTLEEVKLAPHEVSSCLIGEPKKGKKYMAGKSLKPFWKGKSKGPYKWDSVENEGFPWIGFVGYEMHYDGAIRVRKNSLEKELKKQKEIFQKTMGAIGNGQRVSRGTIAESVIRRLIGMSVGRVELWNYATIVHEMCWKNGFQELTANSHSIKQIKRLDRGRSKVYYDLIKECGNPILQRQGKRNISFEKRQIILYNKPFSYYYHVIERASTHVDTKPKDDSDDK
ncbi:reverse transcriptase/maturase family protein [Chitinophaga agri]|uniref:Reverse transcriptase domain-containing protein n=1 Tax=Chitinophaga agri TaxID=2703787 RepID=A0A6B9ZMT6_9BACT|nr:reverse transcriptase/maturase family protein [Chitinophaga agri]QHS63267.1 hypothetical protein GWR21_27880 [Chitinophaga agri]